MKRRFRGPLGPFIKRHLKLRQSLGLALTNDKYVLDDFDRYVAAHFPGAQTVTRAMVAGYLETTRHLHSTSRITRLSNLRQFCRFLFQLHPDTYIPEKHLIPPGQVKVQPHIYTEREVRNLIEAAAALPPPGSLRPHTYATVMGLLWVSGLRIGEVVRLNIEDVDRVEGVLHVQRTKFHKSRLVPLSGSATAALLRYRQQRSAYGHDENPTAPFFVNERARRCTTDTLDDTFRALTTKLGMKTRQGRPPRLHDFRHALAPGVL
ncbi:MAG: tyrosine-type recombinase/integrase [Acidobacteria bacterium]|nr:tyrosine-type recombinase/integrase [Acidobacteriota bacterium]